MQPQAFAQIYYRLGAPMLLYASAIAVKELTKRRIQSQCAFSIQLHTFACRQFPLFCTMYSFYPSRRYP